MSAPRRTAPRWLVGVFAVGSVAAGLAIGFGGRADSDRGSADPGSGEPGPVQAEAVGFWNDDSSLRVWRDYADVVAVAQVSGEARQAPEGDDPVTHRVLELTVGEPLWSRHDFGLRRLSFANHGWVDGESGERELLIGETPRMEVGGSYLVALARDLNGDWDVLATDSIIPVVGGRAKPADGTSTIVREVQDRTAAQIRTDLRALEPDPTVEALAAYPPMIRRGLVEARTEGVDVVGEDNPFTDEQNFPTTTVEDP